MTKLTNFLIVFTFTSYFVIPLGNCNRVTSAPVNSALLPHQIKNLTSEQVEIDSFMVFTKIRYRYARTMVFCQMRNSHPTQGHEVVFALNVSQDAFITNFTMEINGQHSKFLIKEKSQANREYANAQRSGATAGIINQRNEESNNMFKVTINLAANTSVLFFLEYEEEIRKLQTGLYEFSLNFIPQIKQVKHLCIDVEVVDYKPFHVTSVTTCNSKRRNCAFDTDRKNDAIIMPSKNQTLARIIWEPTKLTKLIEIGTTGYFNMQYKLIGNQSNNDVVIRNGYFVHRFFFNELPKMPLHVIFVLDTSGSMMGFRGENMKKAMSKILTDLKDTDIFNLITFSSTVQHWGHNSRNASQLTSFFRAIEENKIPASQYIQNLVFTDGTNILKALQEALKIANSSSSEFHNLCQTLNQWGQSSKICENPEPTPMIFFLTDGYPTDGVTDPSKILEQVKMMNTMKHPIFTVGLGSSAQYSLLQTLSAQYKGLSRQIFDDADVELQLADFYDFAASPVLKDLKFKYTSKIPGMKISEVTFVNENEPWLSSSGEIAVSGKIIFAENTDNKVNWWTHLRHDHGVRSADYLQAEVGASGMSKGGMQFNACLCPCGICQKASKFNSCNFNSTLNIKSDGKLCPKNEQEDAFLERFWVHKTLQKLIREEVKSGNATVLRKILSLSKKYNFVTPYTSMIILTPRNSKGPQINYSPPPAPSLTEPASWKKDGIPKSIVRASDADVFMGKATRFSYSTAPIMTNENEATTLNSFLQSLLQEQAHYLLAEEEESKRNTNTSNNVLLVEKVSLNLQDVQWIETNNDNFTLPMLNRNNETHIFEVLQQNLEVPIMFSKCSVSTKMRGDHKKRGKCMHLINCVEAEYLRDIKLFMKEYFCPIIDSETNVKYIGTCCTKPLNI